MLLNNDDISLSITTDYIELLNQYYYYENYNIDLKNFYVWNNDIFRNVCKCKCVAYLKSDLKIYVWSRS